MKRIQKVMAALYIPIFLFGAFIFGLSMILKVIGAYLMIAKGMAKYEIEVIKRNL